MKKCPFCKVQLDCFICPKCKYKEISENTFLDQIPLSEWMVVLDYFEEDQSRQQEIIKWLENKYSEVVNELKTKNKMPEIYNTCWLYFKDGTLFTSNLLEAIRRFQIRLCMLEQNKIVYEAENNLSKMFFRLKIYYKNNYDLVSI